MRSIRFAPHALLLAGLAGGAMTSCALPSLDVMPRYSQMEVDGQFFSPDESGIVSTSASTDSMGLGDDDGALGLRADFEWGSPHIVFTTDAHEYAGSGTIDAEIEFEGQTIAASTPVDSQLDLDLTSAVLIFDVVPTSLVDVSIGFGAAYLGLDLLVQDATNRIDIDESIPIPVLAANVGFDVGFVECNVLASGLSLSVDDFGGSYIDIDANARVKLFGGKNRLRLSGVLGYRHVGIDVEYDDGSDRVEFDLDYAGPYLGLEVSL